MKKYVMIVLVYSLSLVFAVAAGAAQLKVYVSEFVITGAPNKEEMRPALQTLMQSRLNGEVLKTVDGKSAAEIIVAGSYIAFGKIFSLDAVAKNAEGKVIGRSFVQGDTQDELIPAIGKLAGILSEDISRSYGLSATSASSPSVNAAPVQGKESLTLPAPSEIVRPVQQGKISGSGWISERIPGAMSSFTAGRTLQNGEQEIFAAGNRTLRYYQRGNELRLIAETTLEVGNKILGVDSADLDNDGVTEIFLSVKNGDHVSSIVYIPADGSLKKVAEKLPYLFRSIALDGKEKKLYAQQLNMDDDFYGDVYEVEKKGASYSLAKPLKIPKGSNIFTFNMFSGKGKVFFLSLNADGYLIVFSQQGEELWRSSDKFGGSELSYERAPNSEKSGPFTRNVFLDQRMTVTRDGEIIVPQNAGFWIIGNSRTYSKYSVFAFGWNGASLEEKWHTKQSQNYLADYSYDEQKKELILLEVVQKEGMFDKGATALAVKKLD